MKRKNPNDALFRLVKSMNQGEKRFFSLMCQRQASAKGKGYMKLFSAIDAQAEYDEVKLKKQFKTDEHQYVIAKRYLYTLVLDSLVQHYVRDNETSVLPKLLELEILLAKGLYDLYDLLLYKLRIEAEEKNDFLIVLETFKREKRLQTYSYKYYDEKKLKQIEEKENQYIELYKEVETYYQLSLEVIAYQNDYLKSGTQAFRDIAKRPLFRDLNKPKSVASKISLRNSRGAYYRTSGDHKSSFNEYTAAIQVLDANPAFKRSNPLFTISIYLNYVISCHNIKEYGKGLEYVDKYKEYISHYPEQQKNELTNIYLEELILNKDAGKKSEAMKLIAYLEKEIENKKVARGDKIRLLFQINIAFACSDFSEYQLSLKWINKILNYKDAERISFLYYYNARVLQLFNIFDMKKYELLEFRVTAFQRFILKYGPLSAVDRALLDFFQQLRSKNFTSNKKNIALLVGQLRAEIVKAVEDPAQTEVLLSFPDFSNWFEKHLR